MPASGTIHWRAMTPTDLSEVDRIARIVHPDFPERIETTDEKLALSPGTSFLAIDEDGIPRGYAIAYPWLAHDIPQIDTFFGKLPENPDVLFVHDVALLPSARGLGLVPEILQRFAFLAREAGFRALTLAAVYGSEVAWFRYGFSRVTPDEKLDSQLVQFGTAMFLTRAVDAD